jgi:uncharacterized protein YbaP (TraB family)
MRKKILLLISLAFCLHCGTMAAADGLTTMKIFQNDGSEATIMLADEPKVMMNDQTLSVVTAQQTLQFSLDKLTRFVFTDGSDQSGINANSLKQYSFISNVMILSSLKVGSKVNVYTVDGSIVDTHEVGSDGTATVSLQNFKNGIYLIKTLNGTYKLIKK